jgi:dTDP-4-amino-4,6-dideoxygalactose transaminase
MDRADLFHPVSTKGRRLVTIPILDLKAQYASIRDEITRAIESVVTRQEFIMGREIPELEAKVAELSRAKFGIGCASGTDAILLPLKIMGLQPGDEVIAPSFTFFATAGTIHNAGGTPVFVDIDPGTLCADPAAIEAAITPRTRAIIVVHLFGQMAAMERVVAVAAKHGIPVIEDAAQAIGARRRLDDGWRMAGELGWVGTFSFFPSKNLGGYGDGGLIVTQDEKAAERLRKYRIHGGARQYHHEEVGTNSRLDTIQAAVLLAKLPHLAGWSAARRSRAARYDAGFAGCPAVRTPVVDPRNEHIFHQYTIRVPRRDALLEHLKGQGIGCAVYYPVGLHLQPCFAHLNYRPGSLPETEKAMAEVISLPVYPELADAAVDRVVAAVRGFLG